MKIKSVSNEGSSRYGGQRGATRLAVGGDHAGYPPKGACDRAPGRAVGHDVGDFGTHSLDPVDFPDIAQAVCEIGLQLNRRIAGRGGVSPPFSAPALLYPAVTSRPTKL